MLTENPFFAPSPHPYGLPPFDVITDDHYLPAFDRGMAEQRAEVEAIAASTEPPTFENTVEALERSGQLLRRVSAVFANKSSADTNDTVAAIEAEVSPKLAAHTDAIYLDQRLFSRIEDLYDRRAELDLDPESAWLLERVVKDGVFWAAEQLYGLRFVERQDLPAYHPDVRVFEVFNADGSPLGLFLGDYYTRDSKRGGAWASSFVRQNHLLGQRPVVVNNLNITKPPAGEPTLLTYDEVRTLFHEFGHALHALFSDVRYPRFAGTAVPRDFVEFPSQVNEMWILWPEVLANYAKHYRTGSPLPDDVVERLRASQQWGEGFATTEYLAASALDLAWHQLGPEEALRIRDSADLAAEVEQFEQAALAEAGAAVPAIPPRYRTTYFAHIFDGGYSAGYYSYIWAEVLDADTVTWFEENGGLRRENGDRFRAAILSKGGSVDPMTAYRGLRGRDPEIEPLLRRRGLTG